MSVRDISINDLRRMKKTEGIVFQGCGGDPQEWIDGINDMLGICNLNSREEFETLKKFFKDEELKDKYLEEEIELTRKMMPPEYAEQLIELRLSIAHDYDVRRAAMYLKLLRYSYASSGKSFASQPFDIRKLFPLIQQAGRRLSDVVIENQDFETLIRHYDREDTFFYNPFEDTLTIECEIDRDDGSSYFDYFPTDAETKLMKSLITETIQEDYHQSPKEFCESFFDDSFESEEYNDNIHLSAEFARQG